MAILSLHEFTDIMIREVDRVNQLIEQLLDLSRPAQLTLDPVNIHEILEDVLLLEAKPSAKRRSRSAKMFDPSLPPIRGDRAQLTQVFFNLVKNAFQAMDSSGALTVTTRLETDLSCSRSRHARPIGSSGSTSPTKVPASRTKICRIFSRRSLRPKTNGTGLGLATCYRIIKEHGGTDSSRKHGRERKHL